MRRAWARLLNNPKAEGAALSDHVPELESSDMERFVAALADVLEDEHGRSRVNDDPSPEDVRLAFLQSMRDDTPAMLNDSIRGRAA